jgi:DNA/RNA-binding domain of Phe-tRNA-synthetase-like protein
VGLETTLPDGRMVAIAPEVADRLTCGVIVLDPVTVTEDHAAAEATEALGADLRIIFAGLQPSEISGLKEARTLYKSFGMDPSRHRPSSEALLRRMLKGKGLYRISNVVDSCNLASLHFQLPIGMYDLGKIKGDVTLRTGLEGEEYPGIRKAPVHLTSRLGLFDNEGPFGSPTSDSARTCTSAATRLILAVLMATASFSAAKMEENLLTFAAFFAQYCQSQMVFRAVLQRETS